VIAKPVSIDQNHCNACAELFTLINLCIAPVSRASSLPSPLKGAFAVGYAKTNTVTRHKWSHNASTNANAAQCLQLIGEVCRCRSICYVTGNDDQNDHALLAAHQEATRAVPAASGAFIKVWLF
jgi:hypothetical protein